MRRITYLEKLAYIDNINTVYNACRGILRIKLAAGADPSEFEPAPTTDTTASGTTTPAPTADTTASGTTTPAPTTPAPTAPAAQPGAFRQALQPGMNALSTAFGGAMANGMNRVANDMNKGFGSSMLGLGTGAAAGVAGAMGGGMAGNWLAQRFGWAPHVDENGNKTTGGWMYGSNGQEFKDSPLKAIGRNILGFGGNILGGIGGAMLGYRAGNWAGNQMGRGMNAAANWMQGRGAAKG